MKVYQIKKAVNIISESIIHSTAENKTLWMVPGGSASFYTIKIWEEIKVNPKLNKENLKILLTDERFGPEKNPDSNFWNLVDKNFCSDPKIFKNCYQGDTLEKATKKYLEHTNSCFRWSDFKIGIFGIGIDGHTAGILPNKNELPESQEFVFGYNTETFKRMTLTPKALEQINISFVIANGQEKKEVIAKLINKEGTLENFPALLHHKINQFTIFTDTV